MIEKDNEAILQRCAELAAEKKGRDMLGLELKDLTTVCDYFLLVSATNTRQAQSVCDEIQEKMKDEGCQPLRIEGYRDAQWILMDFGGVIVHIFLPETREHFDLERLWGDARRIEF